MDNVSGPLHGLFQEVEGVAGGLYPRKTPTEYVEYCAVVGCDNNGRVLVGLADLNNRPSCRLELTEENVFSFSVPEIAKFL